MPFCEGSGRPCGLLSFALCFIIFFWFCVSISFPSPSQRGNRPVSKMSEDVASLLQRLREKVELLKQADEDAAQADRDAEQLQKKHKALKVCSEIHCCLDSVPIAPKEDKEIKKDGLGFERCSDREKRKHFRF